MNSFEDAKKSAHNRSSSADYAYDPADRLHQNDSYRIHAPPVLIPQMATTIPAKNDPEDDDESVNMLNDLDHSRDEDTILLLKQIFPDESAESLWQLHLRRCRCVEEENARPVLHACDATSPPARPLHVSMTTSSEVDVGNSEPSMTKPIGRDRIVLPRDFLRLPEHVAVRRCVNGTWRPILVHHLTEQAILGHERRYSKLVSQQSCQYCTRVVRRDPTVGLGMTLVSNETTSKVHLPFIRVSALSSNDNIGGPAFQAGVRCNDILIGIDGVALAEFAWNGESLLRHAVTQIRTVSDPVVLHLIREGNVNISNRTNVVSGDTSRPIPTPSLLDTSDANTDDELSNAPTIRGDMSLHSDLSCSQVMTILDHINPAVVPPSNQVRPFIQALARANVLSTDAEQIRVSRMLDDYDNRANQWEELSAFFDPSKETLISLVNVRKALSIRIVNIFDDDVDTAYTIWVYDSETGKEWYSPIRYFRDFQDLRSSVLPLCTASIQRIDFPKSKRSSLDLFLRSPKRVESNIQRETKSRQLEHFLRVLCSMIYKEKLHPYIAEVAIHLQSFLGCDIKEDDAIPLPKYVDLGNPSTNTDMNNRTPEDLQKDTRLRLKRALQCYTYRLFLLDGLSQIVDRFVGRLRISGPRLQDIEDLEAKGPHVLKARALADLRQIQAFLDKIQNMILEGCAEDFAKIAQRFEFTPIHAHIFRDNDGSVYWDALVREAVREQVEVEIYVPLRSVVSRWLVNGWRHEDMEVYFRMNELRRRPPEFFRLKHHELHHDWSSVTTILSERVGLSTLPCAKLRAIVEAACEVFRMIKPSESHRDPNSEFGADDFLPIFIYCVVRAEMERPCALCVLLRTLCDPINQIGEIGYYLLTFEAAIKHCEEVDLTDHDREEMPSFHSIPLDDY